MNSNEVTKSEGESKNNLLFLANKSPYLKNALSIGNNSNDLG